MNIRQILRVILLVAGIFFVPYLEWSTITRGGRHKKGISTLIEVVISDTETIFLKCKIGFVCYGGYRAHRVDLDYRNIEVSQGLEKDKRMDAFLDIESLALPWSCRLGVDPHTIVVTNIEPNQIHQIKWLRSDDQRVGSHAPHTRAQIGWTPDGQGLVFVNLDGIKTTTGNSALGVSEAQYWTAFVPGSYNVPNILFSVRKILPIVLLKVALWSVFVLTFTLERFWRFRRRGYCPVCDYDLRGTCAGCPECGWNRPVDEGEDDLARELDDN